MITPYDDHLRQIPEELPVDDHAAAQLRCMLFLLCSSFRLHIAAERQR